MDSMVLQLQSLASETGSTTELLRKALMVATKLKIGEFREWIEDELNGYGNKDVPSYRIVPSSAKAWNPYNGWIPIMIRDSPQLSEIISQGHIPTAVPQLEEMAKAETTFFTSPFPPEIEATLMQDSLPLQPARHISKNCLSGIVQTVRNIVLRWALALEEEGILGERLRFSDKEKVKASITPSVQHIHNYYDMRESTGARVYHDSADNSKNIAKE
jgi:hypothetical protein